jgi:3-vinyl bacteriochlorophyllide hydratase
MQHFPGDWRTPGPVVETHNHGFLHIARDGALKYTVVEALIDRIACCPWHAASGASALVHADIPRPRPMLYTPEERRRRDATPWTMVQGVLAPIQFAVFLVSLSLVLNYLTTGTGYQVATASIVLKTVLLYLIMLTGSIWEKKVFNKFLFAPAFFWEDVVSILVLTLHTAYLAELATGSGTPRMLMLLALAAYASYAVNATQFILKLRAARLQAPAAPLSVGGAK